VTTADLTVGCDVPNDALGQIVADGQNTGVTLPSQNSIVNYKSRRKKPCKDLQDNSTAIYDLTAVFQLSRTAVMKKEIKKFHALTS
jgi:hypothetical protein